jgi:lysophospholipase L1-like esterase
MMNALLKVVLIGLIIPVMGIGGITGCDSVKKESSEAKNVTVYLVGDSTVCNYDASQAPRMGWGQVLGKYFAENVKVDNQAASGRSSKSFISENRLQPILDKLKKGDYLFIQFGHNDEKTDEARHTDPYTTFKSTLMQYIDGARKAGAQPVLVTPVNRRKFDSNGKLVQTHGSYPAAMLQLAKEQNVPCIDLTAKSEELFNKLGPEGTLKVFLNLNAGENPNYPDGVQDDTHFCENGANELAKIIVQGVKDNNLPLTKYVK